MPAGEVRADACRSAPSPTRAEPGAAAPRSAPLVTGPPLQARRTHVRYNYVSWMYHLPLCFTRTTAPRSLALLGSEAAANAASNDFDFVGIPEVLSV